MTTKLKNVDKELKLEFSLLTEDFWDFKNNDTKELTHSIHNYPAVMVYPISRNILNIVKKYQPIDSLLDPFMGSGTVLLEGLLAGCSRIYGNDLNPLAHKISKAKTTIITENLVESFKVFEHTLQDNYSLYEVVLNDVDNYIFEQGYDITAKTSQKNDWGANASSILNRFLLDASCDLQIPDIPNLGFWFVPKCILELQIIRNTIMQTLNGDIRDYFMLAFSETTRLVSNRRNGEFKMYRMPAERVLKHKPDVKSTFINIIQQNISKMTQLVERTATLSSHNIHLSFDDARLLSQVPESSMDIVITSPPYGDSRTTVAYGQFSRVSLQWCDYDTLTHKEIIDIDKNLMGGTQFKKGFTNELNSNTLACALTKICEDEENLERAGDVYSFYKDLQTILKTVTSKCKKNSYQFWVVGNRTVKEVLLKTDEILVELSRDLGLVHVTTMHRSISNKVMPSLNSPTNQSGKKIKTMSDELIVVLRKE